MSKYGINYDSSSDNGDFEDFPVDEPVYAMVEKIEGKNSLKGNFYISIRMRDVQNRSRSQFIALFPQIVWKFKKQAKAYLPADAWDAVESCGADGEEKMDALIDAILIGGTEIGNIYKVLKTRRVDNGGVEREEFEFLPITDSEKAEVEQ